jgi:hypothetical protein
MKFPWLISDKKKTYPTPLKSENVQCTSSAFYMKLIYAIQCKKSKYQSNKLYSFSHHSWFRQIKVQQSPICCKTYFTFTFVVLRIMCMVSSHFNKTHYLQFKRKNSTDYDLEFNYQGNYVKSSINTKFLGLIIDDSLLWKAHTDQIMSKLNTVRFVIRMIQSIMSQETLRTVYFSYVHSIMSYGIIFLDQPTIQWKNLQNSKKGD